MCPEWFSCFQSCFLQFTTHPVTVIFLKSDSDPIPGCIKLFHDFSLSLGKRSISLTGSQSS